jgi:hypothetical protein
MIRIGHMILSAIFRSIKFNFAFSYKTIGKLLASLFCIISNLAMSQVSSIYSWTYATSAHVAMSGGTTLATGTGASMDDAIYTNVPIGFTFNFNGTDYTTVGVSTNGFLWFGSTNPATNLYTPISSATAMAGVVSAFGANLVGRASTATLKYNTTGTCPSRIFMVQWFNIKVSGKSSQMDLQLTLTEGSNQVELHFYDALYFVGDTYIAQVGLRGSSNTDYLNRSVISCSNNWNSSTAGGSNAATCQIDGVTCSTYPVAGSRYRFANNGTVSTVTWNGSTNSDWFTASNWTPSVVPTSYKHVVIPAGSTNYPSLTGSTNAFCRNITVDAGASLSSGAGYSGTITISGSLTNNGSIINNGNNYFVITGTAGNTLSGNGDFTSLDLSLYGSCASYTMNNSLVIRKVNINTGATLSMNSFNLTVLTTFTQTGTINQSSGTLQIEDPLPTLTNATFNENTGTTFFAIGTNTVSDNQTIPSIVYYNLKINTNSGFTASIGNGSTVTCNNLIINNSGVYVGTAAVINALNVNSNFDLSPIGNPLVVNLSNNITVAGIMTLHSGIINTGSSKVVINNSAALSVAAGASNTNYSLSYINGNLKRMILSGANANYDFPMGDISTSHYIVMMNNALSGGGFTYIDAFFGPLTNHLDADMVATEPLEPGVTYNHISVEGVWFLNPDSQPTAGSYDIKAYINGFASLVDDEFAVLKRSSSSVSGADWDAGGASVTRPAGSQPGRTVASGYALRSGLTSFSQFGIAHSVSTPLPIELLDFTANYNGIDVDLKWKTASELNNDFFTVERTIDGTNFTEIATVDGAGNTNRIIDYAAKDKYPLNGLSYYRLKQTDFNGKVTYSQVVPIDISMNNFEIVNVWTSPEHEVLELTISCNNNCLMNIELFDVAGKKVFSSTEDLSGNKVKINVPIDNLRTGMYLLKVLNGSTTISRKIIF